MQSLRSLAEFLREVYAKWNADDGTSRGAALAYYTLFSLAPLVMLTIAIVGFALGPAAVENEIILRIRANVGPEVARTLESMLASVASPASGILATALSLATMTFGALGAVGELQRSLNRIFRAPRVEAGGLGLTARRRLAAVLMILAGGLLLLVSMIVSTVLAAAHDMINRHAPFVGPALGPLNLAASLTTSVVLFAAVFRVLPDVTLDWRDTLFGAVVTAVLFAAGRSLVALYLGRAGVSSAYGAAGSLVLLLLWIYYSALIVLLGAEITAVYARRRRHERPTSARVGPKAA